MLLTIKYPLINVKKKGFDPRAKSYLFKKIRFLLLTCDSRKRWILMNIYNNIFSMLFELFEKLVCLFCGDSLRRFFYPTRAHYIDNFGRTVKRVFRANSTHHSAQHLIVRKVPKRHISVGENLKEGYTKRPAIFFVSFRKGFCQNSQKTL